MPFKLICVHEFGNYKRGDVVINQDLVAQHTDDRESHFVRVPLTAADEAELKRVAEEAAKAAFKK